jgi:hemerythrin
MLIDKSTLPQVAMEFMNDVHDEDVDIINDLYELVLKLEQEPSIENEEALEKKYQEWFEHTVEHFRGEEEKMQELRFPPYPMHKGEHDNALRKMDGIFRVWKDTKDLSIIKSYLMDELPQWLTHHIQTMDTVTAMFFSTGLSPCSLKAH